MINYNENFINKSESDLLNRGFLYGDSVFESIKIINNNIIFWEDHYMRLMSSMRIIRIEIPQTYTPNFFKKHGISHKNRFKTWTKYRSTIEKELIEIVEVAKSDIKINPNNVFAVGYSNGGYWASFLAAKNHVNAGASFYGVWSWPRTHNGYPAKYFSQDSNPLLALHGDKETVQTLKYVKPQIIKVAKKSSNFKYHIFSGAGHSWDCKRCKRDGYNPEVTKKSLEMTLNFFKENAIQ